MAKRSRATARTPMDRAADGMQATGAAAGALYEALRQALPMLATGGAQALALAERFVAAAERAAAAHERLAQAQAPGEGRWGPTMRPRVAGCTHPEGLPCRRCGQT